VITRLSLKHLRNFKTKTIDLDDPKIILSGPNGVGKSNTLEAIFALSTGKSFRASYDKEMMEENQVFSRIEGEFTGDRSLVITFGNAEDRFKKTYLVNSSPKRQIDFVGISKQVLFCPQDLDLIIGGPGHRRRYFDNILALVDKDYRTQSIQYDKALRQRNRLLQEQKSTQVWDGIVIQAGRAIQAKRKQYMEFLNEDNQDFTIDYDKSEISQERLTKYKAAELASGLTLVGPHRDDFVVNYHTKQAQKYASRGQQRMAVFWLKRGEIRFVSPEILLLDDIFSELDDRNRSLVLELTHNFVGQIIMASADPHTIESIHAYKVLNLTT
jgi:DNA replication and repair protein RecF